MSQPHEAPKDDDGRKHRRVRNFLLDARFQLKITAYIVMVTLLVAGMLFIFLSSTTGRLFTQMQVAVEAQSKAATTSKELGVCTLNNDIAANMNNPAFEKQLKAMDKEVRVELYSKSGHAFMNENNTKGYNADDAATAWKKTLAFLADHLKQ